MRLLLEPQQPPKRCSDPVVFRNTRAARNSSASRSGNKRRDKNTNEPLQFKPFACRNTTHNTNKRKRGWEPGHDARQTKPQTAQLQIAVLIGTMIAMPWLK
mmetsp:Transcript_23133/g.47130  ORF Transcript_23133/g.47130 Transcript_23133/m.47130 type:complete len:101 (-) Transcript_23133:52-354(-)